MGNDMALAGDGLGGVRLFALRLDDQMRERLPELKCPDLRNKLAPLIDGRRSYAEEGSQLRPGAAKVLNSHGCLDTNICLVHALILSSLNLCVKCTER